ncbi:autotransporter outer membrane beta-barrel domain-containing protein [Chelatococcus sp. GCM10030263]|uniref:autotransporter outer membrane beta-barrel domain-containing protein n=1 Tax=Chelatococcus sp. GCM10030263 TaxID=3273387 RepID=UPI0036113BA1
MLGDGRLPLVMGLVAEKSDPLQPSLDRLVRPGQQGGTIGQTQTQAFLSSVEMGYQFEVASATLLTPTVGLQTIALRQDAFSEYGAGPLNLNVDGKNFVAMRSLLGADLKHRVSLGADGLLEASLRLAWAHDFADSDRSIAASFQQLPSAAFVVHGAQPTRDAAVIGIGLSLHGTAQSSCATMAFTAATSRHTTAPPVSASPSEASAAIARPVLSSDATSPHGMAVCLMRSAILKTKAGLNARSALCSRSHKSR